MQGCLKGILALSQILLQSVFSIGQGGVSHPSVSKSDTLNSESQSLVEIVSLVPEGPGVSGEKSQEEKKDIKFLKSVGFSLSLNPEKTLLKVLAMEPLGKKRREREIIIKIKTELPVELEGRTPYSLILISHGARIPYKFSSPKVTFIPHKKFESRSTYTIEPGGELEGESLTLCLGEFINEGKMLSRESFEFHLLDGFFSNKGVIESQGKFILKGGKKKEKLQFLNTGRITASHIEVGDLLNPFYAFENRNQKNESQNGREGKIEAKVFTGNISIFSNTSKITVSEKVSLYGFALKNMRGSFHSGGTFFADFERVDNAHGSLSGNTHTELKIRQILKNQEGEIGSISPTDLSFYWKVPVRSSTDSLFHWVKNTMELGKVQGTDVSIYAQYLDPNKSEINAPLLTLLTKGASFEKGELYGEKSISLFSEEKVFLNGVQIHTPLLNLCVPDFALDAQEACTNTVVHCDPRRSFSLTSPYCTMGSIAFLQSSFQPSYQKDLLKKALVSDSSSSSSPLSSFSPDLKDSQKKDSAQDSAQDSSSDGVLVSSNFLQNRMTELKEEVDQMAVFFEKEAGRLATFKISIRADLKSEKDIQFVAPLAKVYLGNAVDGSEIGIQAESLRAWVNFLFLLDGHLAAGDAMVHAPSGLKIGRLQERLIEGQSGQRGQMG